jgi:hypothetical protein
MTDTRLYLAGEGTSVGIIAIAAQMATSGKITGAVLFLAGVTAFTYLRYQTAGFDDEDFERAAEDISAVAMELYERAQQDGYEEGRLHGSKGGGNDERKGFQ